MSARLENFSPEEKSSISSILRRKMLLFGAIYTAVLLISAACVIYFNKYSENFYFQDNVEVINVVFVVIGVICGRLLVSEVIEFTREVNVPHKKVVETKVLAKKDGEVQLGNKSFEEDDFLLGADDFDTLKAGDAVRIELSAKSDMLFSLKRI